MLLIWPYASCQQLQRYGTVPGGNTAIPSYKMFIGSLIKPAPTFLLELQQCCIGNGIGASLFAVNGLPQQLKKIIYIYIYVWKYKPGETPGLLLADEWDRWYFITLICLGTSALWVVLHLLKLNHKGKSSHAFRIHVFAVANWRHFSSSKVLEMEYTWPQKQRNPLA